MGAWGCEGAASGGEESSQAKCDGFIAAAGLMGQTVSEVAVLVEEWRGGLDMITNGLVVELSLIILPTSARFLPLKDLRS